MKIEKEVGKEKLADLYNLCIEHNLEIEVRKGKAYLQIAEINYNP